MISSDDAFYKRFERFVRSLSCFRVVQPVSPQPSLLSPLLSLVCGLWSVVSCGRYDAP